MNMRLTSVRVFHIMKDSCHVLYTTDAGKLAMMLDDPHTEVDTLSVICPEGWDIENMHSFHQIEYYDAQDSRFEYINVGTAAQVLTALQSLAQRVTLNEGVQIYCHQVHTAY
jgi:hypothetical protein